jgi:hypothetical protein
VRCCQAWTMITFLSSLLARESMSSLSDIMNFAYKRIRTQCWLNAATRIRSRSDVQAYLSVLPVGDVRRWCWRWT